MNISQNQFSQNSIPKSSNSQTSSITPSTNSFSVTQFTYGANPWSGPNVTGNAFGNEDLFGGPNSVFGVGEFGGLNHYKNRTNYTITR